MFERLSIAVFIFGLMANVFVAWMPKRAHARALSTSYRMSYEVVSTSQQITRRENLEMICYRIDVANSECSWKGGHA